MSEHVVGEGECISSIAFQYGFFPDTLWNLEANAALKDKRKDPNVLFPGDVVVIPDKRTKSLPVDMGKTHVFRRKGVPARLRLQLWGIEEPLANQKYELTVDGKTIQGITDDQGVLEATIPPNAKEGRIVIGEDLLTYPLKFGHLDPMSETRGVQHRLRNLGLFDDEPDGVNDERLKKALVLFQRRFGLEETGELDSATLEKMSALHDTIAPLPPPGNATLNELIDVED